MTKKITAIILSMVILMIPLSADAHNAVKVNKANKTVAITMGNKQTLKGKYVPQTAYVKNSKMYLRSYPRTGNTAVKTVTRGFRCHRFWNNGKWSAIIDLRDKKCYFIESASLQVYPPIKAVYSGAYFRQAGGLNWQGKHYTWYSRRVLPGLKVPGMWIDSQGFVRDGDGYFVCGSCVANKNKRVIVATPFGGYAKCYDCGYVGGNHFDMYVNW